MYLKECAVNLLNYMGGVLSFFSVWHTSPFDMGILWGIATFEIPRWKAYCEKLSQAKGLLYLQMVFCRHMALFLTVVVLEG